MILILLQDCLVTIALAAAIVALAAVIATVVAVATSVTLAAVTAINNYAGLIKFFRTVYIWSSCRLASISYLENFKKDLLRSKDSIQRME